MKFINDKLENLIIKWRRYIHENPELSNQEANTARYIKEELNSCTNINFKELTKNSVIGYLKGKNDGPTIALRADIDALPIEEDTGLPFSSKNKGIMHACGHDAHAAMLMGAATILNEMKDSINGNIKFIFQPAEEEQPGGAIPLIEKGVLENVDMIFGQHIMVIGDLEPGTIAINKGAFMASGDIVEITIKGKGGHSSAPEQSINPIIIGQKVISSINEINNYILSPHDVSSIAICKFTSGNAPNIIPEYATLSGSIRTFDNKNRDLIENKIRDILDGVCKIYGAKYELNYIRGYDPVINDDLASDIVINTAIELFGEEKILFTKPLMASEDFSSYLNVKPGAFFILGAGTIKDGYSLLNHSPSFRIDERALKFGTEMLVNIALNALKELK
ncbi:amidohydrolase [Peptoniphilus sp. AGMB00490]|uniref:Amidohydrolase n=1 Tax=Peptoniphilus faecalis TaxID=2731255 RepID=A0A848RL70_9FIRM|nr:amidohydrolase [Peptoniphilus faecalis]NMW85896.1 amidohydrolase [Peptoniphilus faecalis]